MATKLSSKEYPLVTAWCDRVVRGALFALIFLIPIFFSPWSYGVGEFNKQALLIVLVFVALAAWIIKALVLGQFAFKPHAAHIGLAVLLAVGALSTFFSSAKSTGFWGTGQIAAQSLISVIALAAVYFLVSAVFTKKEISLSLFLLGISGGLALLFGILQMMGWHVIPLAFAKNNSFNTIGSLGSLGFFAAALLPLWIFSAIGSKKWGRMLYLTNIVLSFVTLVLVNYRFTWLVALAASIILLIFWIVKKDVVDARWMFLPVFLFIVSLFFVALTPRLAWLPQNPLEVSLSNKANLEINIRALKSLEFFGAGPANFGQSFAEYKNADFNQSPLWNVNFTSGASKVLTAFTETGITGLAALLLFMGLVLWQGTRLVSSVSSMALALFSVFVVLTFGYFLYNGNMALDFIYFAFAATLAALALEGRKERIFHFSSPVAVIMVVICAAILIFGAWALFSEGQRYVADMQYRRGIELFSRGQKDESLQYLRKAAQSGSSSMYLNQLALFSLVRVQDYANASDPEAAKKAIQALIVDAIKATGASVSLHPENFENWSTRGYVCQNLLGLSGEALDCAIQAYDRAIALNPNSAYLFFQQGNVYLTEAANTPEQAAKSNLIAKAIEKLDRAIELKPNYAAAYLQEGLLYYQEKNWSSAQENFGQALKIIPNYANAMYFSGLTYDKQGQWEAALAQFSKLLELDTRKEYVQKIVDNLRAGKPALEGLVQQPPAPVE